MVKDECIALDEDDNIVGSVNKLDSHTFSKANPRGVLHRAFSVFLFNSEGKLMLQKRAASKITFPNVWTNTCCSHPLSIDGEIDSPADVKKGAVSGVKTAAIRKLEHELGIPPEDVPISKFKFLTRLHYWAADAVTHGKNSKWGEHEIDYILFIKADTKVKLNPEEVSEVKYVTFSELMTMMRPQSGLLWSPWFRIIAEQFLVHWMADLNATLTTNKYVDVATIHRFDPYPEHMGGAGGAGKWLGAAQYAAAGPAAAKASGPAASAADKGKKQGAYGKVITHKHSKIDQLLHFDEVFAAVYFKLTGMPNKVSLKDDNYKFCDDMLGKVSRSFAAVIRQLPRGLCIDILIFYLALRALDTIEDDMEAFKGREAVKIDHLNNFYRTGLVTDGWSMDGVGEGDERVLLQQFHRCVAVFKDLPRASQEVIADITKRMGQGMASYVKKDLGEGTATLEDYYLYCHYVAGLVGEGLSRLFTCCGYESADVEAVAKTLANTMGLFLQKTNIIRDYLEDYVDGRAFWPAQVWKKYAINGRLGDLADPANIGSAVQCLNHLVTDALECVPECCEYMDLLATEEVFRFCAIPQVMAIATLGELYNNPKVFSGVVKIRKGMAAKLILDTKTKGGLHKWFNVLARDILSRVPAADPSAAKTVAICKTIIDITDKEAKMAIAGSYMAVLNVVAPVVLAASTFTLLGPRCLEAVTVAGAVTYKFVLPLKAFAITTQRDAAAALLAVFSSLFLFGYALVAGGRKTLKRSD